MLFCEFVRSGDVLLASVAPGAFCSAVLGTARFGSVTVLKLFTSPLSNTSTTLFVICQNGHSSQPVLRTADLCFLYWRICIVFNFCCNYLIYIDRLAPLLRYVVRPQTRSIAIIPASTVPLVLIWI
ncbi:hypothetical protein V1509DRAFT_186348 [Lipomyces kononenkoae]